MPRGTQRPVQHQRGNNRRPSTQSPCQAVRASCVSQDFLTPPLTCPRILALDVAIQGSPVAKGRPRITMSGHAFTPQKTRYAHESLTLKLSVHRPRVLLSGPIDLELGFTMPIPASTSKARARGLDGQPHTNKPDIDNLVKLVLDAMNGLIITDDATVWRLSCSKVYGLEPSTRISVWLPASPPAQG